MYSEIISTASSEEMEHFFDLNVGKSIFVGGVDRAGTTKVASTLNTRMGCFLPELFLATEVFLFKNNEVEISNLVNFFNSYQGKYFQREYFRDVKNVQVFFNQVVRYIHGVQFGEFIESSPRNLENYHFINKNFDAAFIFMVRDIEEVWQSYVKNGWRPKIKSIFIDHYLNKIKLINSLPKRDNIIVVDYREIGDLEDCVNKLPVRYNCKSVVEVVSEFQSYTESQHKLISERFSCGKPISKSMLSSMGEKNSYLYTSIMGERKSRPILSLLVAMLELLR